MKSFTYVLLVCCISTIGVGCATGRYNYGKIPDTDISVGVGYAPVGLKATTVGNATNVALKRDIIGTVGCTKYVSRSIGFGIQGSSNESVIGSIHVRF